MASGQSDGSADQSLAQAVKAVCAAKEEINIEEV